jgi:hypothetical protein
LPYGTVWWIVRGIRSPGPGCVLFDSDPRCDKCPKAATRAALAARTLSWAARLRERCVPCAVSCARGGSPTNARTPKSSAEVARSRSRRRSGALLVTDTHRRCTAFFAFRSAVCTPRGVAGTTVGSEAQRAQPLAVPPGWKRHLKLE